MEDRSEVGGGRVPPLPLVDGGVHVADPLLLVAVHVLSEGVARLLASLDPGLVQQFLPLVPRHIEGPRVSPVVVPTLAVGLSLLEVRQDGLVVPPVCALPLPPVVILGVTSDVNHRIERAGAPPDPAPRPVHHSVVDVFLRDRVIIPVILVVTQIVGQSCRHVDLPLQPLGAEDCVPGPGLYKEEVGAGVLRQSVGQDTAGRPGSHHDLRRL